MSTALQTTPRALVQLPSRPRGSHSNGFRKCEVISNHYEVGLKPMKKIVIFRLKITPAIALDNRQLRGDLMKKALGELKKHISNPVVSGMNIFSAEESASKEITTEVDGYAINVKQVKVYEIGETPKLLLLFLNNALRQVMGRLGYVEIGKTGKYFNNKQRTNIDNLMMFSGYRSNFVLLQAGFYLRVDPAKKIVRNQTVLQFIDDFYKMHDSLDKEDRRNRLRAELIGKIVMTNYGKTSYYSIADLVFQRLDETTIAEKNISLADYYKAKYQLTIKNPQQPLLRVEPKRSQTNQPPVLLVPELCLMTGIPDNFDEQRRKKISEATIKNPGEKVSEIEGLMKLLKDANEVKELAQFGIEIKRELVKINAKVIPTPKLELGKLRNNACYVMGGKEANFQLFDKPIYNGKHAIKCAVVAVRGTDLRALLQTFESTSEKLAVKMENEVYEFEASRGGKEFQVQLGRAVEKGANICLVVLPNNFKSEYRKLKQFALGDRETVTQMMTEATLRKKNLQSIATKVLLQIIAKRGNTLWVPVLTCALPKTMLIAFDTATGSSGQLIAICATLNSTFTSLFSSQLGFQTEGKFQAMVKLTVEAINAYVLRNEKPPEEMVILLNSCCGDQVSLYHDLYANPLAKYLQEAHQGRSIKFSIVMVNTKNSERFFTPQSTNVQAGTLVSEGLVSVDYDFFMVSQMPTRGSSVPNHYRVVFSNSSMEEGVLQEVCFSQCFNYVNWTGSIKVPAILQYAKKCAKFHAEVMGDVSVAEAIQNKMYFV